MTEIGITDICKCGHDLVSHDLGDPHHRAGACAGHELDGPCECSHYREVCRCAECDADELDTDTVVVVPFSLITLALGTFVGIFIGALLRRR
ncbi:TPA_asm: membrane protein [Mycobacterium phage prophiFSQJ01-1]|nr:Uncharacterised protein [Mycobacteroides abscessus subsp. abscessus]SIK13065.1 Uncharacterised protein [Mycobacteroides abscessus subsp. abscessus]SIN26047.1 Uncharacterised protein [Mycobacteroides abscessus subsp. abscessus]SLI50924.1 Uncharacterised protein [Mycobacteroides abscessus subsp. abscessus]DAZ90378.1 TPA_asm: membrane protein [Mycobacterium phage prophiFSQJ01-1]